MRNKISIQLLVFLVVIMFSTTAILGTLSYSIAKRELINSGKLDLQHIVQNAVTELRFLDKQVKSGVMTLEEAQEEARMMLIGPKTNGGNLIYDFKQSSFTYKENGYLFAYNSNHEVQMHPSQPFGAILADVKDSKGNFVIKDLVELSKNQDPDSRYYTYFWKNPGESLEREKIAYVSYFEEWDWMVGIGAYTDEFYSSLNTLKVWTIVIAVILSVIGSISFYLFLRKHVVILGKLHRASTVVADGDLTVKPVQVNGNNEIASLTSAFNKMVQNLQLLVGNIKDMSLNVSNASTDLNALSEEITASSDEINRAIQEIAKGNQSQAAEIDILSSQTDALATSVKQLTQQNHRILDLTKEATSAIDNGKNQVHSLKDANEASVQSADEVSIGISNLYLKVKEISKIVTTIEQIAEQTNLLALNASIEAARAGEHGKGFAVVAQEVRKLAEATNKSTAEIQEMINGIEKETESTVTTMAKTTEISEVLNKAVQDTEKEFTSISTAITNIIQAIERSSEEIHTIQEKMKHFVDATSAISAVAEQTSASSQEISASVDEQVKAIETMTNAVVNLNELSEQLKQLTNRFTIEHK